MAEQRRSITRVWHGLPWNGLFWATALLLFGAGATFAIAAELEKSRLLRIDPSDLAAIAAGEPVTVVLILNGNELMVEKQGRRAKVRMLAIRSFDPTRNEREITAYGHATVQFLKAELLTKTVTLEFDKPIKDVKGSYLAYVHDEKGNDVNLMMVEKGISMVYTEFSTAKEQAYLQAELLARGSGLGIWIGEKSRIRIQGWRKPSQIETLERAGIREAAQVVVLAQDPARPESDQTTVAIYLTLRALDADLHVVAECVDTENQEVVARSGCDSIVCVMSLAPGLLAPELHDPGVIDVLQELTVWSESLHNIFIVPVQVAKSQGRQVAHLRRWAEEHKILLIGVRTGDRVHLNPANDKSLDDDDAAIVISEHRPARIEI